jgi:tetratricopeptide (TPR) repeat protein
MNAMRKTALSIFLCAVMCAVTAADARDFQFRDFNQSSGERTLNRYMESATRFEDKDLAEQFIHAGVEAAVADWEREALAEMELQVKKQTEAGEDENQVRTELAGQLEQQKIQVTEKAKAQGEDITARLLADLVNMVVPETGRQGLHDEIDAAMEAEPEEELADAYSRWDETAGNALRLLLEEVFSLIETNRQGALDDITHRSEQFRDVYTSRIDERVRRMRELARRDLEIYYLRERNRYMYENYQDTDSLRRLSEAESAAVITGDILNQTGQTVEELMAGLDIDEGLEAALLVGDPGQYTREVQSVIQAGICAWKVAEDRLIAERLAWEKRSFASYDEAEKKWQEGYDQLCEARDQWLEEVHEKISDGYQAWEDTFLSTGQQYQEAITLLEETIQVQRDSWDEYTANMRELVVMGSGAMGVATENLGWLREYEQDLAQMAAGDGDGAYAQVRQKVQEQIRQWEELAGRYERIIARGALQYHEQDMWGRNFDIRESRCVPRRKRNGCTRRKSSINSISVWYHEQ